MRDLILRRAPDGGAPATGRGQPAIWLAFVVVAVVLGQLAGTHKLSESEQSTDESARAQQILASAGFSTPAAESVLARSPHTRSAPPGMGERNE